MGGLGHEEDQGISRYRPPTQWQQWVEWPAAEKSLKFAKVVMVAGRTLWGVGERAYGQWPFVKPGRGARMVIASRTRKDVPPYEAPTDPGKRGI